MLVLITGPAGSGKSTFSKCMQKKSGDVVHIELDDVMINTVFLKKDLTAKNKFGKKITQNAEWVSKFYNIVLPHKKLMSKFFSIFNKNIDKMIEANKDKLILLDSMFFPYIPKYYDKADFVVCITADTELRVERMLKRDKGNNYKSMKRRAEIIDEVFEDKSNFDVILSSNNQEEFEKNSNELADKLIEDYNLNKKNQKINEK